MLKERANRRMGSLVTLKVAIEFEVRANEDPHEPGAYCQKEQKRVLSLREPCCGKVMLEKAIILQRYRLLYQFNIVRFQCISKVFPF